MFKYPTAIVTSMPEAERGFSRNTQMACLFIYVLIPDSARDSCQMPI
jgi:hypothetical protein